MGELCAIGGISLGAGYSYAVLPGYLLNYLPDKAQPYREMIERGIQGVSFLILSPLAFYFLSIPGMGFTRSLLYGSLLVSGSLVDLGLCALPEKYPEKFSYKETALLGDYGDILLPIFFFLLGMIIF